MSHPRNHSFEFFQTPTAFTKYLCAEVSISGQCFAPCVGSGAIIKAFSAQGPRCDWRTNDLDPRWSAETHLDATEADAWPDDIDWTVDNPPFTPALEIIEHAIARSRVGVAMHLRASIHEVLKTGKRRTWMREHTPTGMLWLPRFAYQRSKTTGKWTTDSVCACWVIWMKDRSDQFIRYAPEWVLDALDRETPGYRASMDRIMAERVA